MHRRKWAAIFVIAGATAACSSSRAPDTQAGGAVPGGTGADSAGSSVAPVESPATQSERAALEQALAPVAEVDGPGLASLYPTSFAPAPKYDLSAVAGLATIQASPLPLDDGELAALSDHGFVITARRQWPSFVYGYATLYMADLPVYVSADSILFAMHRSYDSILEQVETNVSARDLAALLDGMRASLASGEHGFAVGSARRDADVFVAVAASLLTGSTAAPVAGGDATQIAELVSKANAASGEAQIQLFGVTRDEDFSEFEPRGHYTDSDDLKRYFRAMLWLGRIDFRLLETQSDGTQLFRRRQLEGALALRDLVGADVLADYQRIDDTVSAFVGEHDYLDLAGLGALLSDLGVSDPSGLAALSDADIAQQIVAGGYGAQRISSAIMVNGMASGTLPLSRSFALFGQRYVLDSHVFSNVVYDRAGGGSVLRMMPNPLDAAFAAFGNNQAAALLSDELAAYDYAPDLGAMRVLADAHPPEFWQESLYNRWLGSLRALAPTAPAAGLPAVAKSELWGKRLLQTELASWAELRHDTILYAKQSYTGGALCNFPDAYVDPYPDFYRAVGAYATAGEALVDELAAAGLPSASASAMRAHFDGLGDVAGRLAQMAEYELTGADFTDDMLAFINDAVTLEHVCSSDVVDHPGWYGALFFGDGLTFDPTIADVHTQPTDAAGNPVGRVLHVGTGPARYMVVIADGCSGPRAYAGLAASYYEKVTDDYERLTDPEWASMVYDETSPPWLSDVVLPAR